MSEDRGKVYDIFFDVTMPYRTLTLLTGERIVPGNGLSVLNLYLNTGDIADRLWEDRFNIIKYFGELYGTDSLEAAKRYYDQKDLTEDIRSARAGKDAVRIWHGTSSKDMCSFLYILRLLKGNEVTVMDMSMERTFRFQDLYNAPDAAVYKAFAGCSILSAKDRKKYEDMWDSLSEENAPARTVTEDGTILGIEESYFDDEILLKAPEGEFTLTSLVGDMALDRRIDDMGNLFWIKRARKLISEGRFSVVRENIDEIYPFDCMLIKK